ncbi:uncharacterized protein LOC128706807 [Anopheles marshallii]|uniref:uncharacterized protein LOC128706807 n=1 Tax=Anopheles marshallii TaxID=1521116 RepID=UPI00237BA266|nr:uncharacterized protein LOC128706807 [Anopheles marshallii]
MNGETNTEAVHSEQQIVAQPETSTDLPSAGSVELMEGLKASPTTQEATKDAPVEQSHDSAEQNATGLHNDDLQEVSAKEEAQLEESKVEVQPVSDLSKSTADATATTTKPVAAEERPQTTEESTEIPAYLYKAIEKVASEQGFTAGEFNLEFDVGSNKGDGFVGQMFKALITEGARKQVFLCKIPPLNEARRRQFNTMSSFSRETLAYKTLLPTIFAYQEEKGVAREDGFFNVPKCYYAECDEATEESVIIMEDLRTMDYRMWNKMKPVNYEHARLTMQHLGRLHAVSLALKRDRPEAFEQFKVPDSLVVMMSDGSPLALMMTQMVNNAKETLEPHETKERAKMEKLAENVRQEMQSCADGASAEPYTVLGHGDCWVNNFMFNYKNKVPDNIILLDWQITRYVSPVLDIAYFLFCCTDEEFRRRYYDEMINIYHNSLGTLLEKLGHSPQEVFPRTALIRQLRRYGKFGILMAVFLVPMMCTRNEDLYDMDETAEKYRDSNELDVNAITTNTNKSAYSKRISAVIRDIVRYGYL